MMMIRFGIAVALIGLGLAGCGTTPEDRAISGGAIGAGAGAVGGALTGNPAAGALLGGAAGAAGGAFTSPNQVDLGRPAWR
jgi:osmotically inducible lipoprotein OsmB